MQECEGDGWCVVCVCACPTSGVPRHTRLPIRPYHTLLLLEDAGELTRALPVDASPQLRALIALADPVKGFDDLQVATRSWSHLPLTLPRAVHVVVACCAAPLPQMPPSTATPPPPRTFVTTPLTTPS
jgi:hypothetical protein